MEKGNINPTLKEAVLSLSIPSRPNRSDYQIRNSILHGGGTDLQAENLLLRQGYELKYNVSRVLDKEETETTGRTTFKEKKTIESIIKID